MRVLIWHLHGGWLDSFVQGPHTYLLPHSPLGGPFGLGRAGRDLPRGAIEVPTDEQLDEVDVVVLQRPEELAECERLTGRIPGRDLPAVFVEHNTPQGNVPNVLHPLADQSDIPVVHVTHFNRLIWDSGRAPTKVIEHGIVDPGFRYTGSAAVQAVVVNEPVRRWRVTGTDLLPAFAAAGPLIAYGIDTHLLPQSLGLDRGRVQVGGDLPAPELRDALPTARLYLHPLRWTSLGLALLEAMHLGMPVVVLQSTEAARAVPPEAGAISADVDELVRAAVRLLADPEEAAKRGRVAREFVLAHYGLNRFLADWESVLTDVIERQQRRAGSLKRGSR